MHMTTGEWLFYFENWKGDYLEKNLGGSEGNYWRPEDKGWVAERKEQWRNVKESLDVLSATWSPFKRKYHKYHKELFFFGTLNPDCRNDADIRQATPIDEFLVTGHAPFMHMLPIFKLWYHPEPSQVDLEGVRADYLSYIKLQTKRKDFFRCWNSGACFSGKVFSPVYGMMGGREALIVRFLLPGMDYRKPAIDGLDASSYAASIRPYDLMQECLWGTVSEMRKDAAFVPFSPGQYLWDHASYNMEYYKDEVFKTDEASLGERRRYLFMVLISELLTFEKRSDRSRHRPSTIAMVERLVGQYERKEFSDGMLALWDECKRNLNELSQMERQLFYEDNETLSRRYGGYPIDKIDERVEQWEQV